MANTLSDVSVSARIAGPVTLTNKATTGGAADAANDLDPTKFNVPPIPTRAASVIPRIRAA